MAYNFLRAERDQPFLLPPDLRDWLPKATWPGSSSTWSTSSTWWPSTVSTVMTGTAIPAYDPKLLPGVRSSRQLERRCREDIAFRVLASNQLPDHVTSTRFRVRHLLPWLGGWMTANNRSGSRLSSASAFGSW